MPVNIIGLENIEEILEKLVKGTEVAQKVEKACLLVETDAKKLAPKGTGELRRSIASRVDIEGDSIIGKVYSPLEYAPYVEYGTGLFAENGGRKDVPWNYQDDKGEWHSTSGMKPTPYMRPALNQNREEILRLLKEGLTDG